jgi:hypothetical protein
MYGDHTAVKFICQYCDRVFGYNSYPHSKTLFNHMSIFYFHKVSATIYTLCDIGKGINHITDKYV